LKMARLSLCKQSSLQIKGRIMKNIIKTLAVTAVLAASVNGASAQSYNYFTPGGGLVGSSQTYGNVTNFFEPGRGLVGTAIRGY